MLRTSSTTKIDLASLAVEFLLTVFTRPGASTLQCHQQQGSTRHVLSLRCLRQNLPIMAGSMHGSSVHETIQAMLACEALPIQFARPNQ
jgi:hypothetical protein